MSYHSYLGELPDPAELLNILAKANRFTLDELAQNRAGRIADSQMAKLTGKALQPLWSALMTFAGWLLFLLVIWEFVPGIILRVTSMLMGKSITAFFFLITLGCVVSLIFGFFRSGAKTIGLVSDLAQGKASCMEGRVWAARRGEDAHGMERLHKEKPESYHYVLNDEYFEVRDLNAWEALAPKELYRLYYAPHSKLLLSIEPVTTAAAATASAS